ncbi:MAG: chorismate synthase, partial [Kaistella sp.]
MFDLGNFLTLSTFGESHGAAYGGIINNVPAGLQIDLNEVQHQLDRRKPGQSAIVTQRKESDTVKFLSGIFDGKTTGTPIGFTIENENQKSKDYDHISKAYRPSHADFTYDHTGVKAIRNFKLEINPGEQIAIVGRTGSGKTTIAQLLMRMFDLDKGNIFFDGKDIRQISLQSLRKQISYVPQDGFLFSDTIENNIAFGTEKKDPEKVKEAARLAVR